MTKFDPAQSALIPVAGYVRVSSDRQDIDLSGAAQRRAIREYAERNGYLVVIVFVDEGESGRFDDRTEFRRMVEVAMGPNPPFRAVLVWKFSRFARNRYHSVLYKTMLREKGIRVISVTEPADDSPTGQLLEGVIEVIDQMYSQTLSEEVLRGMREAAIRGFFMGSQAPFGFKKVQVMDGARVRHTLVPDPDTAPIVLEAFKDCRGGKGLKRICKDFNARGLTLKGRRWTKSGLHVILTNEAYAGTLVWGRTRKGKRVADPIRVEDAWPAIVSRELFDQVQQALASRAPAKRGENPETQRFLLTDLLRCGVCGRPYMVHAAKSNTYHYYVCSKLHREGAGTCDSHYLNALEEDKLFLRRFLQHFVNEVTLGWVAASASYGMDTLAEEYASRLRMIRAMLADVEQRIEVNYELVESRQERLEALAPRLAYLRERQDKLKALRDQVLGAMSTIGDMEAECKRLDEIYDVTKTVEQFRTSLEEGTIQEQREIIRVLVDHIVVLENEEDPELVDLEIHFKIPLAFLE